MRFVALFCLIGVALFLHADEPKLNSIKARTLELKVPGDWKEVPSTSSMRAAQFSIPGTGDDKVDLVVFYFGGPTGGVKANVERWISQFDAKDRKIEMSQGKCAAGTYIIVDAKGTWNKPDGPPFARKTIATPDSRVINAIVIEEDGGKPIDYYFLKLSGKEESVTKQATALRTAIGGNQKAEKPFDLKDAPN